MTHYLKELISERNKGHNKGIVSVCCANEYVIKAAMTRARKKGLPVLIEATANQVNQFGGYTGMKPQDFREFVFKLAEDVDFPGEKIILGGDHLGPLTWKHEAESIAMKKAEELVKLYVKAGFTKIHIDTSMLLGDDDRSRRLSSQIIAARGARLAKAAEEAWNELTNNDPNAVHPVYVIGSEVPVPGGTYEDEGLKVTEPEDFEETVRLFKEAFEKENIKDAFEHVIAVVVQPGVEFSNDSVHEYNRDDAKKLCQTLKKYTNIVFEGHSTDYQKRGALKQMVEDGIAILKVGPALTYVLREGLFMLSYIEKELLYEKPEKQSYFKEVLESVMLENPEHWKAYCHGNYENIRLSRRYGLSDRSRYYLTHPRVKTAIGALMDNLSGNDIPLTLISQYLPMQYEHIREGLIGKTPEELLIDKVGCLLDDYLYATC